MQTIHLSTKPDRSRDFMTDRYCARRRRVTLTLAGAVTAALLFAGSASATVYTPADGTELDTAVAAANANPGADTIVLTNTFYQPAVPIVISEDLTIEGDHALQTGGEGPAIDGS